jgi:hypothetical protein
MANTPNKEPMVVLDFDSFTRIDRVVKIGGVAHPLLSPEIYGPEVQASFLNSRKLLGQYRDNPSKENLEALNKSQDEFIQVIVPSLKDNPILKDLPDRFKESVIDTFFGLVAAVDYRTPEQKALEQAETNQQTQNQ